MELLKRKFMLKNIFYLILILITFNLNNLYSSEFCSKELLSKLASRGGENIIDFSREHLIGTYEYLKRRADIEGDALAQFNLGIMLQREDIPQKSHKEAFKYMKKSAEAGDMFAQFGLGVMYLKGISVSRDYKKAEKWFKKAIDQGILKKVQFRLLLDSILQGVTYKNFEQYSDLRKNINFYK